MKIQFTEDTPVNNGVFKKGEEANFTEDVAQNFINTNKAVKVKKEQKISDKSKK
jgi:hypothetical protein